MEKRSFETVLRTAGRRAALGLALCLAWPAGAQQFPVPTRDTYADSYAQLHGFGDGVAAALAAATPPTRTRARDETSDANKVQTRFYKQPGIDLQVMAGADYSRPSLLVIAQPGYVLPMDLHIGDTRAKVESTLLLGPKSDGDTLVLERPRGAGCGDPITLTFRDGRLAQVAWEWEICAID